MKNCIATAAAAIVMGTVCLRAYGASTIYWDNNGDTAGFGNAGGTWGVDSK